MDFPRARAVVPDLRVVAHTPSTNDELMGDAAGLPEFTTVATLDQTAGRGRLGRDWVAPAGQALAVSVLLRPTFDRGHYGWVPLVAGLAMTRAVRGLLPSADVTLKWPNDVLIGGRKVCGVLAELRPDGAVIVGAGLNLTIPQPELPVPTATSLALEGASGDAGELADAALSGYLTELQQTWHALTVFGGDASASGIRNRVEEMCSTLGARVRVHLPDGEIVDGTATGLDSDGRLRLSRDTDGASLAVAAGDVTHLRYE